MQIIVNLFNALFSKDKSNPYVQFVRYAVSGVIASVVDIGVFYLLAIFILPALTSEDPVARLLSLQMPAMSDGVRSYRFVADKVVSFSIANLVAYVLNITWVFHRGRHKWFYEIAYFYAVSGISVALGVLIGWVMIFFFGFSTTTSFVAQAVCSLLINYVCRKYLIFHG